MAEDNRMQQLSRHLREANSILTSFIAPSNQSNTSQSSTVANPSGTSPSTSTSTTVGSVLNRARAMISRSVSNGAFTRLGRRERLRATAGSSQSASNPTLKKRKEEAKVYEFVLVEVKDTEPMPWSLSEDKVLLRGIIEIDSACKEIEIREQIGKAVRMKYANISNDDLQFLRATRRKLSKPVNCGSFDFKQIKLLAGQGAVYIKLKDWAYCLLEDDASVDDETGI